MTFDSNLFCSRGQTPPALGGHLQTLHSAATCDIVTARALQNEQQKEKGDSPGGSGTDLRS